MNERTNKQTNERTNEQTNARLWTRVKVKMTPVFLSVKHTVFLWCVVFQNKAVDLHDTDIEANLSGGNWQQE